MLYIGNGDYNLDPPSTTHTITCAVGNGDYNLDPAPSTTHTITCAVGNGDYNLDPAPPPLTLSHVYVL